MMNETPRNETKDAAVVEGFVFPASFAQERMWFLDQLEPGSTVYNIPEAIRLQTALDVPALERSLHEIVPRPQVLRTSPSGRDGQPVQVISPEQTFHLPVIDLSSLDPAAREAKALRLATEEALRPFELTRWPLFRVCLLRLEQKEYILLVTMHHIISDGWSLGI